MDVPEDERDLILQVSLLIGSSVLMGSDSSSTQGPPPVIGSNFSISVIPDNKEEAERLFAGLSDGGTTVMPMADAFWGSYFGMCVDPFGVRWQINFEYPVSGASGRRCGSLSTWQVSELDLRSIPTALIEISLGVRKENQKKFPRPRFSYPTD